MSKFNRMEDWFGSREDPFEGLPEDDNELFEYTLRLPHPPDRVVQSLRIVDGRLVATYRFVFSDPDMLETGEYD
ncbi:MAG: hypothetical protein ACOX4G_04110 [Limnochordia bacterium]